MVRKLIAPVIGAVALLLGGGCADGDEDAGEDTEGLETDTADDDAPAGPDDAVTFADPEGSFRLSTGPTWEQRDETGGLAGVTSWTVGPATNGFEPNVNVLTQPVEVEDVEAYLDLTESQAETTPGIEDVDIVDRRTVDGPAGELGVLEYTGTVGGVALHFLAVAAVEEGRATLATFTASPAAFDELVDEIEPYLLTLEPT